MRVLVQTDQQVDDLIHALKHAPLIAFDTETDGLDLHGHSGPASRLIGLSVYHASYTASHSTKDGLEAFCIPACSYYVPVAHGLSMFKPNTKKTSGKHFDRAVQAADDMQAAYDQIAQPLITAYNVHDDVLQRVIDAWATPGTEFIAHNAQFDLTVLSNAGFPTPERVFDTMLGAYVLFSHWRGAYFKMPDTGEKEQGKLQLKWLGRLFKLTEKAGHGLTGNESELVDAVDVLQGQLADLLTLPYALDIKKHLWCLPPFDVGNYAMMDVEITYGLHQVFLDKLAAWDNVPLYRALSDVQKNVAWRMSMTGLRVDRDSAKQMLEVGNRKLVELKAEIVAEVHADFPEAKTCAENADINVENTRQKLVQANAELYEIVRDFDEEDDAIVKELREKADTALSHFDRAQAIAIAAHKKLGALDFNPNSPKQIKEYLADLGIMVETTGKATIDELSDRVPLMALVGQYRATSKLLRTYINKWYEATDRTKGILYPSLNVAFVKTGRWSSSNTYTGNLQNIPRQVATEISPKRLLKAVDPDWWLFEIDYSGLELSVGAWIAETLVGKGRDMTLTNLIEAGEDMHAYTRDTVGVPELLLKDLTPLEWLVNQGEEEVELYAKAKKQKTDINGLFMAEARQKAKTANFLIMYGGGVPALMDTLGIDVPTAMAILAGWRRAYPAITKAQDELTRQALRYRKMPNGDGDFMYLRYPLDSFALTRKYSYYRTHVAQDEARNAFNSVSQGTAGGLTVLSANHVSTRFADDNECKLHLTVHDSIELSLPTRNLSFLTSICDIMTDWPMIRPLLKVSVDAIAPGGSWGDKRAVEDLDKFISTKGKEGY